MSRIPLSWVALLGALLCGGCGKPVATASQRVASLQPVEGLTIGGTPLRAFMEQRTGFILLGTAGVQIDRDPADASRLKYRIMQGKLGGRGIGTIAAIDHRGYFLTAAHVFNRGGPFHVLYRDGDNIKTAEAEVVWKGDPEKGPDLGIVRIPSRLEHVFELASIL